MKKENILVFDKEDNYLSIDETLYPGDVIGWWYKEDEDYHNEYCEAEDDISEYPPFEGIVVPIQDLEGSEKGFEIENAVIVMTSYPTEKCDPEATWIESDEFLCVDEKNPLKGVVFIRRGIKKL